MVLLTALIRINELATPPHLAWLGVRLICINEHRRVQLRMSDPLAP
jgi:hypothetical protein